MPTPASIASRGESNDCGSPSRKTVPGRLVEPVQHVHQRGLAGPVLAEQGVDTPALHREINVVVRDDPGESLRDTVHVDRRVHSPVTPRRSLKERGFRTDASETVV